MDDPEVLWMTRLHSCTRLNIVHRVTQSNEGVIVLTFAQIGMK